MFVDGSPDERVRDEAHYVGACHGKSLLSDSEGGMVKTFAKHNVTNGVLVIDISMNLFQKLDNELSIDSREATIPELSPNKGETAEHWETGQMVTAKDEVRAKSVGSFRRGTIHCGTIH